MCSPLTSNVCRFFFASNFASCGLPLAFVPFFCIVQPCSSLSYSYVIGFLYTVVGILYINDSWCKMRNSREKKLTPTLFRTPENTTGACITKFTTFHRYIMLSLQDVDGSFRCCNDVMVTSCISMPISTLFIPAEPRRLFLYPVFASCTINDNQSY